MKTFLRISFFFLLTSQICFGQSGYVDRDNSEVINDSTILIKRIDHIAAYYNSIAEVDSMLSLFNGILGIPQLLRPAIRDVVSPPNTKFYNTAVYLGNVYLEFITFNIDTLNPPSPTYIPYFNAFAFTNEITNTAAILDSRGIPRSQVFHYSFREPDGTIITPFSSIILSNFDNNDLLVFFCKYYPVSFNCQSLDFCGLPAITDPDSFHIYFGNILDSLNGGPLTVKKVKNIILTSNYFDIYRQRLSTLFFPTEEDEPGRWSPPAGPSLILQSSQTVIQLKAIEIEVDSLQKAKQFLISRGLGFQEVEDYIKLDLSTNIGVDIILTNIITSIEDQLTNIPDYFILTQNYPNPFNPTTKISYAIPQNSFVELKVFNLLGQEIATLVNQEKPAGNYEVNFNASNLPSGVYIYKMKAGEYVETRKMILLK